MLEVLHRFALLVDTLAQKIKPGSESILLLPETGFKSPWWGILYLITTKEVLPPCNMTKFNGQAVNQLA